MYNGLPCLTWRTEKHWNFRANRKLEPNIYYSQYICFCRNSGWENFFCMENKSEKFYSTDRSEFWLLVNYRNYFILRTFSNWFFLVSLFKQHNLMGCHPLSCRVSQMSPFCPVKMSILHASQRNPFIGVYQ